MKSRIILSMDVYDQRLHEGAARYLYNSASHIDLIQATQMPWQELTRSNVKNSLGLLLMARLKENLGPLAVSIQEVSCPVVSLCPTGNLKGYPQVLQDDYAAGRMAAGYFLRLRFRRFALIGQVLDAGYAERVRGFEEVLGEAGQTSMRMVYEDYMRKEAQRKAAMGWDEYLLHHISKAEKPLAIFALDDLIGLSVLRHVRTSGIRVPEEVVVLAVGNDHMFCDYTPPPMSSIDMNMEELGWKGARLLHALIEGEKPANPTVLIAPRGIVERRSTEILSAENPRAMIALRYIMDNLDKPLTSGDVAGEVGISTSQLDRIFLDCFGRTVKQERTRLRMQRVRELLATTDIPAKAIAGALGFRTMAHLSRVFAQENSMTIRAFRTQVRGRQEGLWSNLLSVPRLVQPPATTVGVAADEGPRGLCR